MKQKKYCASLLSLFLTICLLLTSCSSPSIPTNANTAFQNFTRNLFEQDVVSTTIGLHYTLQNPESYGIEEIPITYGSFDVDETASYAALENCSAVLDKFSYNTLSKENQITYDVLSSYLDTAKKGIPYNLYEEPLSPVTGIQAQLPVLLAEYQFFSAKDIETYLALLKTTPEYFDSLIQFEQKKSDAGLFMADYTVDSILEQCNAFLAMGDSNYLLSTFEERLSALENLTAEQKQSYINKNHELLSSSILPAYEHLVSALTKLKGSGKNTKGLCNLPDGKNYYAYLVSRDTGSPDTVETIQKRIYTQISSDLIDMKTVAANNPALSEETIANHHISPSDMIQNLERTIKDAFPTPANVNTKIKYVPKALEPYLSPAFYMIPSIDNTSENVIYINRSHTMEDLRLFTTLAHEGYPGHLYQTTYYASTEPDPLRNLLNFSGYVEGWATYAEMCSYYLSSLEKPHATLLQKNSSILLGLYSAADIGIHYDNWNLAQTIQFFTSYGIKDENTIREIYELIISDPANYLKYYVGYLEILDLKKEMQKKKKENFSQKQFHKSILDIGPAPFDIVEKWMTKT